MACPPVWRLSTRRHRSGPDRDRGGSAKPPAPTVTAAPDRTAGRARDGDPHELFERRGQGSTSEINVTPSSTRAGLLIIFMVRHPDVEGIVAAVPRKPPTRPWPPGSPPIVVRLDAAGPCRSAGCRDRRVAEGPRGRAPVTTAEVVSLRLRRRPAKAAVKLMTFARGGREGLGSSQELMARAGPLGAKPSWCPGAFFCRSPVAPAVAARSSPPERCDSRDDVHLGSRPGRI